MTRARIFSQLLSGNVSLSGLGGSANITLASLSPFLTTANVIELTNLYFSNARVYANLQLASLNDLYDVNTVNKSNGQALIWTGNIWAPGNVSIATLTTDDIREGVSNLYYTNTRARTALTAADPTIVIDWVAGTIRANIEAVSAASGTTDTIPEGSVNKYFTNARVFANLQLASINDLFDVALSTLSNNEVLAYDTITGKWQNKIPVANAVTSIANFTTDDLIEGTTNKYLTYGTLANVLANVSIDNLLDVNTQSNLTVNSVLGWDGTQWVPTIIDLGLSGLSNVALFANYANIAGVANVANTVLTISNFTTANLLESNVSLYYTNARVLSAVNPRLTTANVIEISTNLYFTNARVVTVVTPLLTTANVIETSNNLYYTNARVLATLANNIVETKDLTVNGNITVNGDLALLNVSNVQISSKTITIAKDAGTQIQAEGSGIYINGANASITYNATQDAIGVNKNITVYGNILPALSGIFNVGSPDKKFRSIYLGTQTIFLGNVTMGETPKGGLAVTTATGDPSDGAFANLSATQSITVDRVYGNVFPLTEFNSYIGGNVDQFLSNVTGNLYFGIRKNADWNKFAGVRVTEVRGPDGNVRSDVIIYNDKENSNNSTARISVLGSGNVEIHTDIVVQGNLDIRNNITANGSILFKSGDYVQSSDANPLTINGLRGIDFLSNNITAWRIDENSYDLIAPHSDQQANVFTLGLVSATRFYGNVQANTILTDSINANTAILGNIVVGTATFDNVIAKTATFESVVIQNNLRVYGGVETYSSNNLSVSDNMIYLNSGSLESNPDIGFAFNYNDGVYHHGGFFRDASDGVFKVFDNYQPEPDANIFINTNHATFRLANLQATNYIGNVTGFVTGQVSSLGNHSTTDLAEGTNQYFTNTRVLQVVNPLLTTANILETSEQYFTNVRVLQVVNPLLTTSNVIEGTNQYFTNARVLSNVEQMSINVLADVDITGVSLNKALIWNGTSFVPGDAVANTVQFAYVANVANLVLSLSNFTTANLAEGVNLYYTNARVLSYITAPIVGNITATGTITATSIVANSIVTGSGVGGSITGLDSLVAGSIYASNVIANVWIGLYTANVIESPTNQFFTNARTVTAVTPLLTTANVVETTNQYFTNAKVYANISQASINVLADVDTVTIAPENGYALIWNGTAWAPNVVASQTLTSVNSSNVSGIANVSLLANLANVALVANSANTVVSLDNLTTTDLKEGSNLYFTSARVINAVTPLLTTANVTETTNQYFTNVRVLQAVNPLLTTANVVETTNQYFTNARVLANVEQMSINVLADVDITGIQNSGILQWNGTKFIAGTVSAATTSNTSLFAFLADFANTAGLANVATTVTTLSNFTTANLAEGTNLYFTNARAAIGLTGQDVSLRDLYVAGNLTVQGDTTTLNVTTLTVEDKNITIAKNASNSPEADGAGFTIPGADATLLYKAIGDKFEVNKNFTVNGSITANSWNGLYTTNVIEGINQFFTNARVMANVELMSVNVFTDVDITGIQNTQILQWNGSKFIAANINTGEFANFSLLSNVANTVVSIANHTTTDLREGANLYFTNTRAIAAVQNADLVLGNVRTTGLLTVTSAPSAESVTGIEFVNNPVGGIGDTAKLQYYGAGSGDDTIFEISVANNPGDSINFKTLGGGVGINRDRPAADFDVNGNVLFEKSLTVQGPTYGQLGQFNALVSNSLIVNGSTVVSAEGTLANITVYKITANVWNNLYSANVIESPTNLFYTNARVLANVSEMSVNVFADVDISNILPNGILKWDGTKFIAGVVDTGAQSNIALFAYFADAANVALVANFANTSQISNVALVANSANTVVSLSNHTTTNLNEGSNLYYTDSRVYSNVTTLLPTYAGDIMLGNAVVHGIVEFTNTSKIAKVYQYYNESTQSLDTVFL
jgi:hypothetical protein